MCRQRPFSNRPAVRLAATALALTLFAPASPALATDDHPLLCEAAIDGAEFIEIHNPTDEAIDLRAYYLSDDEDYAKLPGHFGAGPAPSIGSTDFIARFPPGALLPAGETVVVALAGSAFSAQFDPADYEIKSTDATADMEEAYPGSIGNGTYWGLTNAGEHVVLFRWDGTSDLVEDVDMVNLGTPDDSNDVGDKSSLAVDGPDSDSAATPYRDDAGAMPDQGSDPDEGESTKRVAFEAGNELAAGGNGAGGDDETSEDILRTWDSLYTFSFPDPGTCCLTTDCYYETVDSSGRQQLRSTLHDTIDDHHYFSWGSSWTWTVLELADEDLTDPTHAHVIDVYKNATHLKGAHGTGGVDREHTWPNSYGYPDPARDAVDDVDKQNYPYSDLHGLFLADHCYNSTCSGQPAGRLAKPYRFCPGCVEWPTETNDGRGGLGGPYPGDSNWAEGGAVDAWETWMGRRGDVARAVFYMDLRYEKEPDGSHQTHRDGSAEPDLILTNDETKIVSAAGDNAVEGWMGILDDLLKWHRQDPPDSREAWRNEVIHLYQRNRNPFIDHPEWVDCLYFDGACPSAVDLAIDKDDGWTEAAPGETATYRLEVSNQGAETVAWAEVRDLFDPASFDLGAISWTCVPAPAAGPLTECPASGGAAELAAGVAVFLEAGDSVRFSVAAPILLAATGTLVNTATVTPPPGIPDTDPLDDAATDTDALLPLGACGAAVDRHLTGVIDGERLFTACRSILADEVEVVAPLGDLTLVAGLGVELGEDFRVEAGCELTVEIDPALAPG